MRGRFSQRSVSAQTEEMEGISEKSKEFDLLKFWRLMMERKMKLNEDIEWTHHNKPLLAIQSSNFPFKRKITKIHIHVETLVCLLSTS